MDGDTIVHKELRESINSLTQCIAELTTEDQEQSDKSNDQTEAKNASTNSRESIPKTISIAVSQMNDMMMSDQQIIQHELQSQRCCCCDLQIALTICFIWIILCCSQVNMISHWFLFPISSIQILSMMIGIIGIWKANRKYLKIAKYVILFNMVLMMVATLILIINVFDLLFTSSTQVLPKWIAIFEKPFDLYSPNKLNHLKIFGMALWTITCMINIALQTWMIGTITRAIDTISQFKENKKAKSYIV